MAYKYKTIDVDEHGRSCVVAVNGDEEATPGGFAADLAAGDEVDLDDGSTWTVDTVYSYIQVGNPGSGASNFVAVDLVQRD